MSDAEARRAEDLWEAGHTYPEIAAALGIELEVVYLRLESRRLRPWSAARSVRALEHEQRRRREADQLIAEVEDYLRKVAL